jgi:uncharacterized membrane protein
MMAAPAKADFGICNKTNMTVYAAVGYSDDGQWTSEGWWELAPGECATMLSRKLSKKFYYYYAESSDQEWFWESEGNDNLFCASDNAFKIVGAEDCKGRGYDVYGFREVDVGDNITYSIDLTADQ